MPIQRNDIVSQPKECFVSSKILSDIQWLPKLPGQEIFRGFNNIIIYLKTIYVPY